MKKLFTIILLLSIASLSACKKKNIDTNNTSLTGNWEYRGRTCFCVPENPADYSPGNQNIINFTETAYTHYKKGTVIKSGTYVTIKDTVTFPGATANRIIYDNDTQTKTFFKIENNKLTFYGTVSIAADGLEEYYERQ